VEERDGASDDAIETKLRELVLSAGTYTLPFSALLETLVAHFKDPSLRSRRNFVSFKLQKIFDEDLTPPPSPSNEPDLEESVSSKSRSPQETPKRKRRNSVSTASVNRKQKKGLDLPRSLAEFIGREVYDKNEVWEIVKTYILEQRLQSPEHLEFVCPDVSLANFLFGSSGEGSASVHILDIPQVILESLESCESVINGNPRKKKASAMTLSMATDRIVSKDLSRLVKCPRIASRSEVLRKVAEYVRKNNLEKDG